MIHYLKTNLKSRVLVAFLAIGLIPYILIMLYFNYWVHNSLEKEQSLRLITQAKQSKNIIQNRLSQLQSELKFISSLEIFNDMITEDLDSRILRLLELKANIGEYERLTLYALDREFKVIASSHQNALNTRVKLTNTHSFVREGSLYIINPLLSSFNKKFLGYLVAKYPLENLNSFVIQPLNSSYEILQKSQLLKEKSSYISVEFQNLLKNYKLVYKMNEDFTLKLIFQSMLILFLILLIGSLLIYYFSKKLTREIVNPIVELTNISTEIVKSKNYDLKIESKSEDEIGALANIFNLLTMLQLEKIELLEKVSAASEAKSSFISGMSHELRTPLNAIIGFSQYLIAYENLNEEQSEIVQKIEKASLHLLSIINEVLDIAKIEAGKMDVNNSDIEIQKLLQESVDLVAPLAIEKKLSLELSSLKLNIVSDEKRLKQIVINLLSNAIKFTNEGYVKIQAQRVNNQLIISVKDTGIGISKENLKKVFKQFIQLRDSNSKASKGSGLGLSLSRNIAEALEIELVLKSDGEGKGTQAELIINL